MVIPPTVLPDSVAISGSGIRLGRELDISPPKHHFATPSSITTPKHLLSSISLSPCSSTSCTPSPCPSTPSTIHPCPAPPSWRSRAPSPRLAPPPLRQHTPPPCPTSTAPSPAPSSSVKPSRAPAPSPAKPAKLPPVLTSQQRRLRALFKLRTQTRQTHRRVSQYQPLRGWPQPRFPDLMSMEDVEDYVKQLTRIPDDFRCPACSSRLDLVPNDFGRSRSRIVQHLYTHVPRNDCVYRCPDDVCDYASYSINNVSRHFTRRHGIWTDVIAESCPYGPNRQRHKALFTSEPTRQA